MRLIRIYSIILVLITLTTLLFLFKNGSASTSSVSQTNVNMKGYALQVYTPNDQLHQSYIIDMTQGSTFNHKIMFMNSSGRTSTFSLLVYLNYQQIPFKADTNGLNEYAYQFTLEQDKSILIPLEFSTDDLAEGTHALTFSIIAGSDKHASALDVVTDSFGISGRFNLRLNANKQTGIALTPEIIKDTFKQNTYSGLLINQDRNQKEKFLTPQKLITAKSGGMIELALRGGGTPNEEYVVWLTVDWKQIKAFDEKAFLFFRIPKNESMYTPITFKAPTQPGEYEIAAYMTPNPFKQLDDGFFQDISTYTSHRFTLKVE
ncbi:hypothetical protein BC351_05500 [Paenibacillus ferrarius]|uniref:Uncharacterized protein n=1 Tax=Paenibacillus ferrarius TaxID=1469647 RepID=A0A1V4HFF9_9BACL|nr:hypothetical protein [Paenibacillus ferrarius]OPH53331.1 hypothetical protein BC351_05500 [Paenibacillus ferrarius]